MGKKKQDQEWIEKMAEDPHKLMLLFLGAAACVRIIRLLELIEDDDLPPTQEVQ
jgi:hypothetical protein